MATVTIEMPEELLAELDCHVGVNGTYGDRSEAVRAAITRMLDQLDEVDRGHGGLPDGGSNGRR